MLPIFMACWRFSRTGCFAPNVKCCRSCRGIATTAARRRCLHFVGIFCTETSSPPAIRFIIFARIGTAAARSCSGGRRRAGQRRRRALDFTRAWPIVVGEVRPQASSLDGQHVLDAVLDLGSNDRRLRPPPRRLPRVLQQPARNPLPPACCCCCCLCPFWLTACRLEDCTCAAALVFWFEHFSLCLENVAKIAPLAKRLWV